MKKILIFMLLCIGIFAFDISDYLIDPETPVTDKASVILNSSITQIVTGDITTETAIAVEPKVPKKYQPYASIGMHSPQLYNFKDMESDYQLITLGIIKDKIDYTYSYFELKDGGYSQVVSIKKYYDLDSVYLFAGVGITNKYSNNLLEYKGYGIIPIVGAGYKIDDKQSIDINMYETSTTLNYKYYF